MTAPADVVEQGYRQGRHRPGNTGPLVLPAPVCTHTVAGGYVRSCEAPGCPMPMGDMGRTREFPAITFTTQPLPVVPSQGPDPEPPTTAIRLHPPLITRGLALAIVVVVCGVAAVVVLTLLAVSRASGGLPAPVPTPAVSTSYEPECVVTTPAGMSCYGGMY